MRVRNGVRVTVMTTVKLTVRVTPVTVRVREIGRDSVCKPDLSPENGAFVKSKVGLPIMSNTNI